MGDADAIGADQVRAWLHALHRASRCRCVGIGEGPAQAQVDGVRLIELRGQGASRRACRW